MTSTLSAVGSGSFSYDSNDRLTTDTIDNNGNTTLSGGVSNTYDFEKRMTAHQTTTPTTMVYDGDGNRVSETVGGATTKYLVDTLNPTGLPQVLDETVNGAVTRTYAYGLQRISENQLNGSTWTPSFYGYDGHGNVRFLTNSAATVTDTYQYDAFGRLIASTGSTPNNFLYSGEQFDSNVGLYNLRARYYNQGTGRFWTRDPAEGNLGLPQTLHKYLYVGGDPVMFRDPTGYEEAEEEAGALNIDITFTKHGAEHLVGTNVSQSEIEPIIEADMREILAGRQAPLGSLGREWWGYVQVQGIGFIYKVYVVSAAWLSVSSYYTE